jgi:hypothetical protein
MRLFYYNLTHLTRKKQELYMYKHKADKWKKNN